MSTRLVIILVTLVVVERERAVHTPIHTNPGGRLSPDVFDRRPVRQNRARPKEERDLFNGEATPVLWPPSRRQPVQKSTHRVPVHFATLFAAAGLSPIRPLLWSRMRPIVSIV